MGGGKGGGGGGTTVIQFAPYIEKAHQELLDNEGGTVLAKSVFEALNAAFNQSPYHTLVDVDPDDGYLGGVNVTSYPALFKVYDNYVFGVDTIDTWQQLQAQSVNNSIISDAVAAQSAIIDSEMDATILPRLKAGFRDINAVQSSTFISAKALLAREKVIMLQDFSSKLQMHQYDVAHARWEATLNWNKAITAMYGDAMKMYYSARFDADNRQMEFKVKDTLWNLSLFEYGRSMVAALNGASAAKPELMPSQAAKSISMAAAGAGAGATIASMIDKSYAGAGAAVGGALGLAGSFS